MGLCPPSPAQVASPFPIQIGEPAQVVGDDVVVLAARTGHNDHTLVISQLGDLLRGPGPTDLVETTGEAIGLALPLPERPLPL